MSFLLTFAIALALPVAAEAQTTDAPGNPVAVIKVEGAIDRPLMGYLQSQIMQRVERIAWHSTEFPIWTYVSPP